MRSKKAQATAFIIIGILVLSISLFIFFISNYVTLSSVQSDQDQQVTSLLQINSIQSYMDNCVKETLSDSVIWTGQQGGYFESPEISIGYFSDVWQVPLYYYNDSNYLPEIYTFEKEIESYVEENLNTTCNLTIFTKEGFNITQKGEIKSKTKITDYGIILQVNYPLEVTHGSSYWQSDLVEVKSSLNFKDVYALAKAIISDKKETGLLCLNCFTELVTDFQFKQFFDNTDGKSYITIFDKQNYQFTFAMENNNYTLFDEWEDEI